MVDTIRTVTALQALYADNITGAISEQDGRDFIVSAIGVVPYVAKTANYTATENDGLIDCDSTSGAFTITLPAVATTRAGKLYTIRKTNTSAAAVTIDGASSELINGDTTQLLFTQYAYATIVNTGAAWDIIASYGVMSGAAFIATGSATAGDTVAETDILGTGVGTKTLPANFFRVGKAIRIKMAGVVSTNATPTLTLSLKFGSTVLATSGAVTMENGITNLGWELEAIIVCRTVGGSGTVMTQGGLIYGAAGSRLGLASTAAVTVDTTAAQTIGFTVQWSAQHASNTITCSEFLVEILR